MQRMEAASIKIAGMTCGGCVNSVTRALRRVEGVADVDVSLERGEASVRYDPARASREALLAAVRGAGYEADAAEVARAEQRPHGCCR